MAEDMKIPVTVFIGLFVAVVFGLSCVLAGFGSRWGWWYFRTGFIILRWSAYGGLVAILACSIGLIGSMRGGITVGAALALIGVLIGIATAGIPLSWQQALKRVPRIHDITTDTTNPPQFISILPLRKNASNQAEYGGPEVAAQQLAAYPDTKPLVVNQPVAIVFERALDSARRMGWEIIDANKNDGRIEAVDTTFWFGFKDDIVIRVRADGSGSRIDLRSVSREGRSDVGMNAKRIQAFLKMMQS
jgi:uncharacterized protein (DUF1499 family)